MELGHKTDGKALLGDCIQLLSVEQKLDMGSNRALYPVILVFFGGETEDFVSTVQSTLEDNWNNAKFLKYLRIEKQQDGFCCHDIVSGEESSDTTAFLEKTVVEMLATEEYVFEEKNRVKFEFILRGEDEHAREYYRLALDLNENHSYSVLKTVYVMMDESAREKKEKTRQLLKYITEHREEEKTRQGTIYLLSNYLKNGSMLLNQRLLLNYRLAANIILLGGNQASDGGRAAIRSVYQNDSIKTAAYALVEKPIRNITLVSLIGLMEGLMRQGDKSFSREDGQEFTYTEELKKRLGIQPGRINCVEELFNKEIAVLLPKPEELCFLPYLSDKDFKDAHREKTVSWNDLDTKTGKNWSLFFQRHYEQPMKDKLSDSYFQYSCSEYLQNVWRKEISYFDALYGLEGGRISQAIQELSPVAAIREGNSIEEGIHFQAVGELKKAFYQQLKGLLVQNIQSFYDNARQLKEDYEQLLAQIRQEDIDVREQKKNIQKYYAAVVDGFIKKDGERGMKTVFCLQKTRQQMIEAIKALFVQLLKDNAVYGCSFERELAERLEDASDEDRRLLVTNELEQNIEEYGRLHWNSFTYSNQTRGTYYLVNRNAEYAGELNPNSAEYAIFHLNRTDCIEKIAIYDLDKPNSYCDLVEMAGGVG